MTTDRPHFPPPDASQRFGGPSSAPTRPVPSAQNVGARSVAAPTVRVPSVGRRPSPHWLLTVTGTVLCFVVGVIGLVFSATTAARWRAGDERGARTASRLAWWFGIIAIVTFLVIVTIVVIAAANDPSATY